MTRSSTPASDARDAPRPEAGGGARAADPPAARRTRCRRSLTATALPRRRRWPTRPGNPALAGAACRRRPPRARAPAKCAAAMGGDRIRAFPRGAGRRAAGDSRGARGPLAPRRVPLPLKSLVRSHGQRIDAGAPRRARVRAARRVAVEGHPPRSYAAAAQPPVAHPAGRVGEEPERPAGRRPSELASDSTQRFSDGLLALHKAMRARRAARGGAARRVRPPPRARARAARAAPTSPRRREPPLRAVDDVGARAAPMPPVAAPTSPVPRRESAPRRRRSTRWRGRCSRHRPRRKRPPVQFGQTAPARVRAALRQRLCFDAVLGCYFDVARRRTAAPLRCVVTPARRRRRRATAREPGITWLRLRFQGVRA